MYAKLHQNQIISCEHCRVYNVTNNHTVENIIPPPASLVGPTTTVPVCSGVYPGEEWRSLRQWKSWGGIFFSWGGGILGF